MLAELTARGIRPDHVYGASVGAVNAAAYCGDPTMAGVEHLANIWLSVVGEDVFPRSRVHGPWKFFQHVPAAHSNRGLRRIVERGLRFERLEEAVVPLDIVATSLVDGSERWLTEGPAVEAILASAAIPAVLPPVALDGDLLVDGGVVNNVPISRALAHGATRIYVLLCGPLQFRPKPPTRPVETLVTAFFVGVHSRFVRELAQLPPGVEVIVFSGTEPSTDYRDFSASASLMDAGRNEVATVLDGPGATPRWREVPAAVP
jgi:NTE family protein